jgi:hypothetical protein
MMNKVYYDLAIREAYEKGKAENKEKYDKIIKFLEEYKDKNNYISKKIRLLLEELNK